MTNTGPTATHPAYRSLMLASEEVRANATGHGEFCAQGGPCCACERCGQHPCPLCEETAA